MERAIILEPGFSTADADYPDICDTEAGLLVKFNDWQENNIEVLFSEAIAFKWQLIETFIEGEEYDRCHEIENSMWLKEHYKQGELEKNESYKHYKFNFNACGQLEVLASGFSFKT